jgi:hypothetical protein
MKYTIDYGSGTAKLYTPSRDWKERFYKLASQCFGIRKNIMKCELINQEDTEPPYKIVGEYERLEHSGDTIVWGEDGSKIKSEFG